MSGVLFDKYGIEPDCPFDWDDPKYRGNGARNMTTRDAQRMVDALRAREHSTKVGSGEHIVNQCRKILGLEVGEGLVEAVRDLKSQAVPHGPYDTMVRCGETGAMAKDGSCLVHEGYDCLVRLDKVRETRNELVELRATVDRMLQRLLTVGSWVDAEDGVVDLLKVANDKLESAHQTLENVCNNDRTPKYKWDEARPDGASPSPGARWATPKAIAEYYIVKAKKP